MTIRARRWTAPDRTARAGTSQSYGQENKLAIVDPHEINPGLYCNPNTSPFGPQPNRTKP